MSSTDEMKRLCAPFEPAAVRWRVGSVTRSGAITLLAYLDARDVQNRLDYVWGAGWANEFRAYPGGSGLICGITSPAGVTRWDGAELTQIEAAKGGLSDSFKRAAVQWGVGRYLYGLGTTWADVVSQGECRRAAKSGWPCGYDKKAEKYWALPKEAMAALAAAGR